MEVDPTNKQKRNNSSNYTIQTIHSKGLSLVKLVSPIHLRKYVVSFFFPSKKKCGMHTCGMHACKSRLARDLKPLQCRILTGKNDVSGPAHWEESEASTEGLLEHCILAPE